MEKAVHIQNVQDNAPQFTSLEPDVVELANRGLYSERASVQYNAEDIESSEVALTSVDPSMLNTDQMRAYDIITWHLQETLSGHTPPPLQMLIHGEGGTGKSKVIQTVTDYFDMKGASALLVKAAYTGVAASLIGGKTTHTIAHISRKNTTIKDDTKHKLQSSWKYCLYLIIDEMSMLSKTFLAKLSHNIGIGKMVEGQAFRSQARIRSEASMWLCVAISTNSHRLLSVHGRRYTFRAACKEILRTRKLVEQSTRNSPQWYY